MSEAEREELTQRVNAMTLEEKELVTSLLPIELVYAHVGAELEKLQTKIEMAEKALQM